MTMKETAEFFKAVKAAYPTSSMFKTDKMTLYNTCVIWANTFKDISLEIMCLALREHIQTNKFAPSVADIINAIKTVYYNAFADINICRHAGDEEGARKARAIMSDAKFSIFASDTLPDQRIGGLLHE